MENLTVLWFNYQHAKDEALDAERRYNRDPSSDKRQLMIKARELEEKKLKIYENALEGEK